MVLNVRATPGAKVPGVGGAVAGPHERVFLQVKLHAKAEDGAANEELLAVLGRWLARPRSSLTLESGMTARFKSIRIAGRAAETAQRLKELIVA